MSRISPKVKKAKNFMYSKKLVLGLFNRMPIGMVTAINCYRRRNYWLAQNIIFVHVPKAAGTSISHALYGRSLGHLKATDIRRYCPNEFSTLFKFGFVRNPWARAFSAYKFALKGSTETAGMHAPQKYQIREFRRFDTFVKEWLVHKELTKINNVFRPQHLFVVDAKGKILVDFIGKVEQIDEDILKLADLTGRKLTVPQLNRVTEPGIYRKHYQDPQIVNLVGDLYQKDISLFGYCF